MTLPVDYANATVSLDTHPDAHNATNAAVNDLDTAVTDHLADTADAHDASAISVVDTGGYFTATHVEGALAELGTTAGLSTTILDGLGAPSIGLGTEGDYYLDVTNRILYGPKSSGGFGVDQIPVVAGTPDVSVPGAYASGTRWTVNSDGRITGVRYKTRTDASDAQRIRLWSAAGSVLASVDDTRTTTGEYTVTFGTPVTIASGDTITVSYGSTSGTAQLQFINGVAAVATGTANVTFVGTYESWSDEFPSHVRTNVTYNVEPIFQATAPIWPVAVYGIPAGGTTGQFLKKTSGTDFAVAWVT